MRIGWMVAAALALAGCGSAEQAQTLVTADSRTYEVEGPPPPASQQASGAPDAEPLKVAIPQIAYIYHYAFVVADGAVARVQQSHLALCDRLGPRRCQVLELRRATGEDSAATASLKLRVASSVARPFGDALAKSVAGAGGRTVDQSIAAEDVSKQIVDAEARIRQRALLVQRLTEILRTREGKVAELVEAERSVAAAQEEMDAARGWLAQLRGRVAMSTVEINYSSVISARGDRFVTRLGEGAQRSLATFVDSVGMIVNLAVFLLPWAAVLALVIWGWRRLRRRRHAEAFEPTD
jgi:hypothetical protein